MAIISCKINGKEYKLDADPQMPLLWAIRDVAGRAVVGALAHSLHTTTKTETHTLKNEAIKKLPVFNSRR